MGKKVKRQRKSRMPKIRGWKKKRRAAVKIYGITPEGFQLRTFNRDYYVSRDTFAWFLDASDNEIRDVTLFPCMCCDPLNCRCNDDHPGDHFRWERLDVDLCTWDFEYPEKRHVYHAANPHREKHGRSNH